ncbi:hypothetical protein [Bradyrhizobium sp. 23AC]
MTGRRPHHHLPSTDPVAKLIADARELTARSMELLKSCPAPDSFAGRRTQEPFPREEDLPSPTEN